LSGLANVELWYGSTLESVLATDIPNAGWFIWDVPQYQHLNSDYRILVVDSASPRWRAATTEFSVGPTCGPGWTSRSATGPSARCGHAMAYVASDGTILLLGGGVIGGTLGDTWVWNGAAWTHVSDAGPAGRTEHEMAYDMVRGEVVLFGGIAYPGGLKLGDTWIWNGTQWVQRFPAHHPSPRFGYAMAYDSARGVVVLFGGADGTNCLNDTWEWDGTDWTLRTPSDRPGTRYYHNMVYDDCRHVTVLFGGFDGGDFYQDTWEYDGTNWIRRNPLHEPPARSNHGMAFYGAHCRTVVVGGVAGGSSQLLGDTWEWDGDDWLAVPGLAPSPRAALGLAYNAQRRAVMMFGGQVGPTEFDSATFGYGWPCRGDMNCDGAVDFDDINPFVTALVSPASYNAQYPDCYWFSGDCNLDGTVDFDDINPFVGLLVNP
jgi:hypothetical protein